jgi:modification methylase, type III R/M system
MQNNSLEQLKTSLKEMFQFQNNDLNFGIFKIYKLKQKEIEKFIDENLENIVKKELQNISNLEEKADILELKLFLRQFNQEKLLENIEKNYEKIE